jgi:hypothetical protein
VTSLTAQSKYPEYITIDVPKNNFFLSIAISVLGAKTIRGRHLCDTSHRALLDADSA